MQCRLKSVSPPSMALCPDHCEYLVVINRDVSLSCLKEDTLMPPRLTLATLWAYTSSCLGPPQLAARPNLSPPVSQGHLGQTFYCGLCAGVTGCCGSQESCTALWMGLIHRHIFQILFLKLAYNPPPAIFQKLMWNLNKWLHTFAWETGQFWFPWDDNVAVSWSKMSLFRAKQDTYLINFCVNSKQLRHFSL